MGPGSRGGRCSWSGRMWSRSGMREWRCCSGGGGGVGGAGSGWWEKVKKVFVSSEAEEEETEGPVAEEAKPTTTTTTTTTTLGLGPEEEWLQGVVEEVAERRDAAKVATAEFWQRIDDL